jgi:chromosome segregation ATPase
MKATEENIFPACDKFFSDNNCVPTADEVVAMCGGGKKEVLAIKKKWEALHYLKQHGLNVPTRWLSMLGDYFKAIQEDIEVERNNMEVEINEKIESVNVELIAEKKKKLELASKNTVLLDDLEALKVQNDNLKTSMSAVEMQVERLSSLKEKLNAEISEKTLQVRLQIDQINDLKQEHENILSRQKDDHEEIVKNYRSDINNQNERIKEYVSKCDTLNDRLMVANTENARLKSELQSAKKESKEKTVCVDELSLEKTLLTSKNSELEKQLSEEISKTAQISRLKALIEQLKQQQMESESAKRYGLEMKFEELTFMFKSLSDQVKQKGNLDE